MKKIIYRFRSTGEISHDADPEDYQAFYDEEALAKKINAYNREGKILRAEIVELDDIAEFYRTRKLNAYKEQLNDFAFMEDRLDELSRMIEGYIDEAKKAYKEKQE